jgi:hypothetical protein
MIALLLIIALLVTIGGVYAVNYFLKDSNTISGTIGSGTVQVDVVLTMNPPAPTDADTITLTATTSSQGEGLSAHLYNGAIDLGAKTITGGQAIWTITPMSYGAVYSFQVRGA